MKKHTDDKTHDSEASGHQVETKNQNSSDKKVEHSKTAKIVIPGLTILAALLYVQGRLYHEGYLRAMGIDPTLLPASTTDAYWWALNGLALMVAKGVTAIWNAYPLMLKRTWIAYVTLSVAILVSWLADRRGWIDKLRHWLKRDRSQGKFSVPQVTWPFVTCLLTILAMPLLLLFVLMGIGAIITVFCYPYDALGRIEAKAECKYPAAQFQLVRFEGDESAGADGKGAPTARLLQCGTDFCGLIRDGTTFVIPRKSIVRTEGVPIVLPGNKKQSLATPTKTPPEAMICYKPPLITPEGTKSISTHLRASSD